MAVYGGGWLRGLLDPTLRREEPSGKGWRATFYTTGMEHSPTSAIGTGWGGARLARGAAGRVGGGQ